MMNKTRYKYINKKAREKENSKVVTEAVIDHSDRPEEVRLNKYIAETGYCSRREADKLVEAGKVYIDGQKALMGQKIIPGQEVTIDGKLVTKEEELVYIALNKPVGITCTTEKKVKGNIVDFVNHEKRIYNIGRLDKDSQGLILMTNDGDVVNKILRAGNDHEKEYIVQVDRKITNEFIKKMSSGVPILDTITKECKVTKEGEDVFRIVLTQGLNRQIRRMCEALGYNVVKLQRVRIMNIGLGTLKVGEWRNLTYKELKILNDMIKNSRR